MIISFRDKFSIKPVLWSGSSKDYLRECYFEGLFVILSSSFMMQFSQLFLEIFWESVICCSFLQYNSYMF